MPKQATKKKIEADSKGKLIFSSQLDRMAPDVPGPQQEKAPETADEYIAREYGEAIKAANVARILEGILVELVKWRMGK